MSKSTKAKREAFRLSEFINPSGETVWRVSGTKKDGTRVRKNFKTESEAITGKQGFELEDLNIQPIPMRATKLTPEQLADAERAVAELKTGSLFLAVRFYNDNHRPSFSTATVKDAVELFKTAQATRGLRPDTLSNWRFRLAAFVEWLPEGKLVSEVLPDQIDSFLNRENGKTRGLRAKINDRLALSKFFNWSVEKKFCSESPVKTSQSIKVDSKRPSILDLETSRKLMAVVKSYQDGKYIPYVALGLFCGLRPDEAERMKWSNIDFTENEILVNPDMTKTRTDRFVKMPDNAVAWLLPHADKKTPFPLPRRDRDEIKKLMGWEEWPTDILRHTALSNHLAEHNHQGLTAEWAGNSIKVLKSKYRKAVKDKDAKEFWTITPATCEEKVLELKVA